MLEKKYQILINITVDSNNSKGESPNPEYLGKEQIGKTVQSAAKRIKPTSTSIVQSLVDIQESPVNLESYVEGEGMEHAKNITFKEYGFISRTAPISFCTIK
jgi:hypothetical protein